ncbi:Rha family transcriptional regulator [Halalkalibacterium halodurans]|uniref:Rha family transcriptional regulator n=1 Tax=Halalkalibacterium halodurans TaxID=86665 RepID=UPI002AA9B030|nr:phage antirepressor KilAC domain-containing protein [Halalkalibacterium halodurans]MDY7224675.1 phage antirepressor KilAC domain-containing protein [Halalkalibacterium halodurans]MDY7243275.1 phage antirepressor KilAC domain-containing protein [Halalkalibacterium halodurans]
MSQLKILTQDGKLLVDSRGVAQMTGKRHADLIRDIDGYKEILDQNENLRSDSFFVESSYKSGTGKSYRCYLLTRKGCDMVANKMTGEKGVLFTAAYVTQFEEMEQQLKQSYRLPTTYKEALQQLLATVEHNEKLQTENLVLVQQNKELKPKASYYDMVLQNKSLLSVSKIAKDYGMSAIALNKKLRELGVQYKQGDIWLLYAKYQDKGYTQTTTHVIDADKSKVSTKWTQKGRLFIYDLLKKEGILPMIERDDHDLTGTEV